MFNGIYAIKITNTRNLLFRIANRASTWLFNDSKVSKGCLITLNVYDNDIFLKIGEMTELK